MVGVKSFLWGGDNIFLSVSGGLVQSHQKIKGSEEWKVKEDEMGGGGCGGGEGGGEGVVGGGGGGGGREGDGGGCCGGGGGGGGAGGRGGGAGGGGRRGGGEKLRELVVVMLFSGLFLVSGGVALGGVGWLGAELFFVCLQRWCLVLGRRC